MNKRIIILIASCLLSLLLMGIAPGNIWINGNPDGYPWPKEVNNGEPTMEKVYINWGALQIGSPDEVNSDWSQSTSINEQYYFIKNNNVYYWFFLPDSKFQKVGLCRWRYLYDSTLEW